MNFPGWLPAPSLELSLTLFFEETDLPTFTSFSQLGLGYVPRGNLAQGFCSISHALGCKFCESNNDVWGRIEIGVPIISKVESAFDPSPPTDVLLTVV